jgi:hypothetical protein
LPQLNTKLAIFPHRTLLHKTRLLTGNLFKKVKNPAGAFINRPVVAKTITPN